MDVLELKEDAVERKTMARTLQIATVGADPEDVLVGIRSFPVHKLALICHDNDRESVEKFSWNLKQTLKIPLDVYSAKDDMIRNVLAIVAEILRKDGEEYGDVILNVAGGDKTLTCAAVSAAFVNGLKAFHLMGDMPVMLPILKLSYSELVSKAKIDILEAIDKVGGEVKSLEELSQVSGYGKPLLSHHIQGAEDSRGLVELGLVETQRVERGKLTIKLSTLGRILLDSTRI